MSRFSRRLYKTSRRDNCVVYSPKLAKSFWNSTNDTIDFRQKTYHKSILKICNNLYYLRRNALYFIFINELQNMSSKDI